MMNTLPQTLRVRQNFPVQPPVDIAAVVANEFNTDRIRRSIHRGMRIAVAVGSRGITNIAQIVRAILEGIQSLDAHPYIIPAMGSHGGATPEGQRAVLANYGITEEAMGVAIRDSLNTRSVGTTADEVNVPCSLDALAADGILLVNRIKPHTDFSGSLGSGLLKMSVIGLGKRDGATAMHRAAARLGYERAIRSMAAVLCQQTPILGGFAILENQFHDTAKIGFIERDAMELEESQWLEQARRWMPLLPFEEIDLLIVDQIGKEISGAGMDPNIIHRSVHGYSTLVAQEPRESLVIHRIFVRDLSQATHGNAIGIGMADATTKRLVQSIHSETTHINALTANTPQSAKIPIAFDNDRSAIEAMLSLLPIDRWQDARMVRIADTLSVAEMEISENLWKEAQGKLTATTPLRDLAFDSEGNLA